MARLIWIELSVDVEILYRRFCLTYGSVGDCVAGRAKVTRMGLLELWC